MPRQAGKNFFTRNGDIGKGFFLQLERKSVVPYDYARALEINDSLLQCYIEEQRRKGVTGDLEEKAKRNFRNNFKACSHRFEEWDNITKCRNPGKSLIVVLPCCFSSFSYATCLDSLLGGYPEAWLEEIGWSPAATNAGVEDINAGSDGEEEEETQEPTRISHTPPP